MSLSGTTRLSFVDRLRDRNDGNAWSEFRRSYGELLFGYARRLGATHDQAEDVAQEVQMYLFKAMEGFRHFTRKGCFRAYLRTAVRHAVARRRGKESHNEALTDPHIFEAIAAEAEPPDPAWEREQYLHSLRWALRLIAREFEPVTLEAFRLHVLADNSAADTAELLGISKDSVYQAKSRVIRRLRERVASMGSEVLDF